jgi:uncharacterized membrane protein YsdA (DUF1294 family)
MNEFVLPAVCALLVILNLISFFLMAFDKHLAKAGKRRVPEKVLFISTICFGGLGGVLGMILCRHKTKHWYFKLFFPIFLIAQIAVLAFLYMSYNGNLNF